MSKYTITPWRQQNDLLAVRAELYRLDTKNNPNSNHRRHAIDRVMAWKLRGNLPHAVESTALLTDAILHHRASSANSTFSIRAVYSAALTRFVTGFCDMGRARERMLEPSSMLEIARQLGMPGEFVALRHEATHGELPALKRLVQASEEALAWLWKVYWARLDEDKLAAATKATEVKDEARKALRAFRSARREVLRAGPQGSASYARVAHDAAMTCVQLCGDGKQGAETLAELLVAERLMLPSSRQLGSSIEGAILLWRDLLGELAAGCRYFTSGLVDRFAEALSETPESDEQQDVAKEAQMLWIVALVRDGAASGEGDDLSSLPARVVKSCCLHPGYWTASLGQILIDSDEELADGWRSLLEASALQDVGDVDMDAPHDVQTKADAAVLGVATINSESSPRGWHRAGLHPRVPIGVA